MPAPRGYAKIAAEVAKEAGLRTAKPTLCPKCGAECLRGDDGDKIALTATVDPEPLDRVGEMVAHFDGRWTYDLVPMTGKTAKDGARELHHRMPWHRGSERVFGQVVADHVCKENKKCSLW